MKRTVIVLLGCMCVMLSACIDLSDEVTQVIEVTSLSFTAEGGTQKVISSNMELNMSGYPDWMTVTKKKDGNLYIFEAAAEKNESKDARIGQIVYDYNKVSKKSTQTASGTITVLQFGKTTEEMVSLNDGVLEPFKKTGAEPKSHTSSIFK
jgi:hypothetical protein